MSLYHHPHHLSPAVAADAGFRPYGNPSAPGIQAPDLSLFQSMGDSLKHPAYGGALSAPPHKLMSIIGKSQSDIDRSVKARAVPAILPPSPSSPPFLAGKELQPGGPAAMHPWFMQQQQQPPTVSAKKRRQLSESASGKPILNTYTACARSTETKQKQKAA